MTLVKNESYERMKLQAANAALYANPNGQKSPLVVPTEPFDRYLILARLLLSGKSSIGYEYDSDDDPESIIGRYCFCISMSYWFTLALLTKTFFPVNIVQGE